MAGDPADFDIREPGTLTLPMPLTVVIGCADNCAQFKDAQALVQHDVLRGYHRASDDWPAGAKMHPGIP
ncbi:MAG TPA: hypothetical protein VJP04_16395 [Terriglobales bacterium]|nr:hypothetical protein [Terriglobales bacterium]